MSVNLYEILRTYAGASPCKARVTFVEESLDDAESLGHTEIAKLAFGVSEKLLELGLKPGDRVGLTAFGAKDFVLLFLGCVAAGLIAVPVAPPVHLKGINSYKQQLRRILKNAGVEVLFTLPKLKPFLGDLIQNPLRKLILASEILSNVSLSEDRRTDREVKEEDLLFLQYTSGSTAAPKGVKISYGNLRANVDAIAKRLNLSSETDKGVSWLPLCHDMGLIGSVLTPYIHQVNFVVISPALFLRKPSQWLDAIARFRGTVSFAPNFAFALVTKRVKKGIDKPFDLSTWRIAGCGAEPVRASTLREFADYFADWGFSEEAFFPCYGLAESTLATTFPEPGAGLHVDTVSPEALAERGEIEPPSGSSSQALELVACGKPFPGHEVKIVDESDNFLAERKVGEIIIKGPSVTKGYYNNSEADAERFKEGYFYSGDLGYFKEGELYICGRLKEVIILSGKNYYPSDIEWIASEIEGVRKGSVVAFGVQTEDKDDALIVVAETKENEDIYPELRRKIITALVDAIGLMPRDVVLCPVGTIKKTTSGKLKRAELRERYLEGELKEVKVTSAFQELTKGFVVSQLAFMKNRLRGFLQ